MCSFIFRYMMLSNVFNSCFLCGKLFTPLLEPFLCYLYLLNFCFLLRWRKSRLFTTCSTLVMYVSVKMYFFWYLIWNLFTSLSNTQISIHFEIMNFRLIDFRFSKRIFPLLNLLKKSIFFSTWKYLIEYILQKHILITIPNIIELWYVNNKSELKLLHLEMINV